MNIIFFNLKFMYNMVFICSLLMCRRRGGRWRFWCCGFCRGSLVRRRDGGWQLKRGSPRPRSIVGGLQPVCSNPQFKPLGSRALRGQTWLRKIEARSYIDMFSYQTTRHNFLRRFCKAMSGFAKLLSAQRTKRGLLNCWLEPFSYYQVFIVIRDSKIK